MNNTFPKQSESTKEDFQKFWEDEEYGDYFYGVIYENKISDNTWEYKDRKTYTLTRITSEENTFIDLTNF